MKIIKLKIFLLTNTRRTLLHNLIILIIKIKWKRKYLQIADNCQSYVCDINCYATSTNESPVLTILPNASIPILGHFYKFILLSKN